MAEAKIRTKYNSRSRSKGLSSSAPSMVKPDGSSTYISDINEIVAQHMKTGILPSYNDQVPVHGDFSAALSLHEAMNLVTQSRQLFLELPAEVRFQANNDPVRFLEMLASPEGTAVLQDAGLEGIFREGDSLVPADDQGNPPAPDSKPEPPQPPIPSPITNPEPSE